MPKVGELKRVILGRPPTPVMVRFWNQVRKTDNCWEWIGAKDGDGYGQFTTTNKKNNRAHRFSYEIHKGPIAKGLRVLHSCDNPSCVNPNHLSLGTDADNLKDAINKGRLKLKGEHNPSSKLTENQVREIRELRKSGVSIKDIAARYKVSDFPIRGIINGTRWKHVS